MNLTLGNTLDGCSVSVAKFTDILSNKASTSFVCFSFEIKVTDVSCRIASTTELRVASDSPPEFTNLNVICVNIITVNIRFTSILLMNKHLTAYFLL